MARRKAKRYRDKRYQQQHQEAIAEQYSANPLLQTKVTELLYEVEQARSVSSNHPDYSKAISVIATTPELAETLTAIQRRQEARQLALKSSPTDTTPQSAYGSGGWGGNNEPVGVINASLLRKWTEENPLVRAAIKFRRVQVEGMRPVIMPINPMKPYNRNVAQQLQGLFDQPNERRDSWRSLIGPTWEDLLALDRGVMLKDMTVARQPVNLYSEDGATVSIYPGWTGNPDEPRYLYKSPNGQTKKPLRNDECIMMMDNEANYRYNLSIVQVLNQTIQADIAASVSALKIMAMKPPPHAMQIPKMSKPQMDAIIAEYDSKIAGKKNLFWFGGNEIAHLFPLVYSAKDQQWLEYQVYLARKIAILFSLSPQKFGFTMDVNRANGEVQEDIDEDRGLLPLLLLLEEYLNREIVGDFAPKLPNDKSDLAALNLCVMFPQVSEAQRKKHYQDTVQMVEQSLGGGMPSMTLNMVLGILGEPPVPGGNTFYIKTATGVVKWLSYDETITPEQQLGQLPGQTGNTQQPSEGQKEDNTSDEAQKHFAVFDVRNLRKAGSDWSPTTWQHMMLLSADNESTSKRAIPKEKRGQQKANDERKAQEVLEQAVTNVFETARTRGLIGLQRES